MGEIGYFWKNVDNQLPAEAGLVQHRLSYSKPMLCNWLAVAWLPVRRHNKTRYSSFFVHFRDNFSKFVLSLGITLIYGKTDNFLR